MAARRSNRGRGRFRLSVDRAFVLKGGTDRHRHGHFRRVTPGDSLQLLTAQSSKVGTQVRAQPPVQGEPVQSGVAGNAALNPQATFTGRMCTATGSLTRPSRRPSLRSMRA